LRIVTKNQAKSWYSIIFCTIKIVWENYFSGPFVTSRNISKVLLFWSFPVSKNHLKNYIFLRYMMTTMEEHLYGFYQFPGLKNHWEEKKIFKFLASRNTFKGGGFHQFLTWKFYDKIWHCLNIFCNFCVSENLGMSPVSDTRNPNKSL